jgi:hypothetical protein
MPEESLETQDLKDNLDEAAERAEGGGARWTVWLSLSTAILAVLAAIASLQSGAWANEAILRKNDAALHQSKAGDAWAHYQAKGIKATIFMTQADATSNPALAAQWHGEAERERGEANEAKGEAEREEARVEEMDHDAEHSLHRHHGFAIAVTIFQVSIAVAAIAALTKSKAMWWASLAAGALGAVQFFMGFLHG